MTTPGTPGSPTALRDANRRRVLRAVREAGGLTQAEIARGTGLSPATVSNVVSALVAQGILEKSPTTSQGRRATRVSLSRSAGAVIGVDFGHSHLRVAVTDLTQQILAETFGDLDVDRDAQAGVDALERSVAEVLAAAGVARDRVLAVGVGMPGPIDVHTGRVGSSSILPGWVGVSVRDVLESRLGMPVHVDNDANLGAIAEVSQGAARGCTDAVYIKVATGVGAGLVIGGRIHRGRSGTAGEIGHTTLDEQGAVCRCGNRGCLETQAGGAAILELLRNSLGPGASLRRVVALALEGDPRCRRVVADAGRHIGMAVANVTNLLNPDRVVVGGQLAAAGELVLHPLRDVVERHAIPSASATLSVVGGELGDRAEMLGAIAFALAEAEPGLARLSVASA